MSSRKQNGSTIKYLIVGDSGVGKTSLLVRYCQNQFSYEYLSTIGVDFKIKRIQCNGMEVTLNIWDTAGQQRFRNVTKSFYKGAHGIIIAYSITDRDSFTHVERWVDQIREVSSSEIPMVLIGTKIDLENQRKITQEEGIELAQRYSMEFLETSAKNDQNVGDAFLKLTDQVIKTGGLTKNQHKSTVKAMVPKQQKKKSENDCC